MEPMPLLPLRNAIPALQSNTALVYLDTAATALQCEASLQAMTDLEEGGRGNVHRGMHFLSERTTQLYEDARSTVQKFLNAHHSREIIFTKNATEGLNLIAHSLAAQLSPTDVIVLSLLEHHSNIVPWQQIAVQTGCRIEWWRPQADGTLHLSDLEKLLSIHSVKMVSVTGLSNVLGISPDLPGIVQAAHKAGALVCIDAAQLAAHQAIDVQKLDCDFLVFSGHKLYGPTGVGVLYGKEALLNSLPAFLGGGGMISTVTEAGFTSADLPQKFEAGTPPFAQAIGLAAALQWLQQTPWSDIAAHEQSLLSMACEKLRAIPNLTLLGPNGNHHGCVSFTITGVHPHDLTEALGRECICLRAGHHCTQPLHNLLGVTASTRLSVGIYNNVSDLHTAVAAIERTAQRLHV